MQAAGWRDATTMTSAQGKSCMCTTYRVLASRPTTSHYIDSTMQLAFGVVVGGGERVKVCTLSDAPLGDTIAVT